MRGKEEKRCEIEDVRSLIVGFMDGMDVVDGTDIITGAWSWA